VSIDLSGNRYPSLSADVEFEYVAENPGIGYIHIDIANNSSVPVGEDPRLTAFAFNLPDGVSYGNWLMQPPGIDSWEVISRTNGINTPDQFGMFDIAFVTGPNFNGGSPNDGIAVGQSFHFEIRLNGTGMDALTEASFLNLSSTAVNGHLNPQNFIARFQQVGPGGGGSDVAIPGTAVPEPSTLLLLGIGLVGIAGIGRKKRI